MTKVETKQNIIEVALHFFSEYGYDGTSIRDLAAKANVNVASINYHFGSKQNLYWASMKHSHDVFRIKIEELSNNTENINQMMVQVFNFVLEDPSLFKATMKMMMTDGVPDPDPEYYDASCEKGPPGVEAIASVIMREKGMESISEEKLAWAIRAIFGNLVHWCLVSTTSKMQMLLKANKAPIDLDGIRRELVLTTEAIFTQLKARP